MQLKIDADTFDHHQKLFVREIIEQIRFKLITAGYEGERLKEVTGEIAFSVASTIDDTAGIEFEGTEVRPYITFRDEEDQLLHCGENSYMHEYVASLMDELFTN
jgi:hypothetical protein